MKSVPLRPLLLLFAVALLPGCDRDEIRSYTAPRDDDPGSGPARVLAAIVPVGDDTWFIKMAGRNDVLSGLQPSYEQFIASLTFPKGKDAKKDESLAWKVPEGWEEDRTRPNRVATLKPKGAPGPELTITRLPAAAAALKPNVDRWRKNDLGLPPLSPRLLDKVVRRRTVSGHEVTLVDLRGPGTKAAPRMGRLPDGHPPARGRPTGKLPFTYKAPPGWQEGGTGVMVVASLVVRDGGEEGKLTITPTGGSMQGGLLANVNRWRGEVGLPPVKEGDLDKVSMTSLKIDGVAGKMIDLEGTGKRSLIAWFERGGATWFFKFRGPPRLVGAQRTNFEKFMTSIRFTGGADE